MIVVDGANLIFGRVASKVAKELLNGNNVVLVNAEKMIISGSPSSILDRYKVKRSLKFKGNPDKSSKWSRIPRMFVKRLIRGMVPWKKPKGKMAMKSLMVYEGVPADMIDRKDWVVYEDAKPKNVSKYMTIARICKMFGYEG